MDKPITIGVLRGGPSTEYEISMKTGGAVLKTLRNEPLVSPYRVSDILIDRSGTWHIDGVPKTPDRIAQQVDLFINALHGEYGEDGKVQQVLEQHLASYTGSTPLGAALSWNKELAKRKLATHDRMRVAKHMLIPPFQEDFDGTDVQYAIREAGRVFKELPPPWVVKPVAGGSSLGVYVARDFGMLRGALEDAAEYRQGMIVEELIAGREASCGIIEGFRGEQHYSLPVSEVAATSEKDFFDYFDKYEEHIDRVTTPGRFSREEKEEIQELARIAHQELGLQHYSQSDFIVTKDKGIYLLETNALPGLTDQSIFPRSLEAVGSSLAEFLDHLITFANQKK